MNLATPKKPTDAEIRARDVQRTEVEGGHGPRNTDRGSELDERAVDRFVGAAHSNPFLDDWLPRVPVPWLPRCSDRTRRERSRKHKQNPRSTNPVAVMPANDPIRKYSIPPSTHNAPRCMAKAAPSR